ncbi:hypothetical protein DXG03_001675 [Asterophora parasitica]|uniref:RNB domain-containing protein n=1 Tax=Asterophora parasitica TaxID=117018 RepID=A0A9P7GAA9_9AGAR|nr:hypothetical protein DXG03_001675 [Asterophora parasitica]
MSVEQEEYEAERDFAEVEGDEYASLLSLGTFVETRRNTIITHGVVLGSMLKARRRRVVILTATGEIWDPVREDIVFNIPDFVSVDLVERCGKRRFTTDRSQINARVEVLKHIRQMDRNIETTYTSVFQKNSKAYEAVRSPDPLKWSETSVTQVAELISPNPTTLTLLATHKFLMQNALCFVASEGYATTQTFRVRPKSHVDNIRRIQDWSRLRESPIRPFAAKARKIITSSQKTHIASWEEAPSIHPGAHDWTDTDREILIFLQRSLRRTRSTQMDPYSLGQSFILKQVQLVQARIDDAEVQNILVDLGVLAPWQDLFALEPSLDLDTEPEATSSRTKAREAVAARGFASRASSTHKGPLGPDDFHPSDPLDSVRHDFGDMPVFVIDEGTAEELDDGVSIERIPSEPGSFWAHIHIADPASIIPPTHMLAKEASIRGVSAYFLHRSWPLFPRSLMKDPQLGLSLGAREEGLPTPVLTFSVKVDPQGQLADSTVRAGLIRKIHIVTYDEVDIAMGAPNIPRWYPYGRIRPPKSPLPVTLTKSQIKDLQDLHTVAGQIVLKRQRDGVVHLGRATVEFHTVIRPPKDISGPVFEPTTFRGFPALEHSLAQSQDTDSGSRGMVSEMAKLASRAASRFLLEKGVPMIRRWSDPRGFLTYGDAQELLDLRTPNNYVPYEVGMAKVEALPVAEYTLEPKAHFSLAIPDGEGYCRATSPLRRYIDLVAHWQLHHALLGSAAPTTSAPFDADQLSKLAVNTHVSERSLQSVERGHMRYWQLMLLKRWAEGTAMGIERHNDPLQNLEAVAIGLPALNSATSKFHVEAYIPLLGLPTSIENLEAWEFDLPLGTKLPVKVQSCQLGVRPQLLVVPK